MATPGIQEQFSLGVDTGFDSYLDGDLLLDASSPAPDTPLRDTLKFGIKQGSRVAPLSALPSRLSLDVDRYGHSMPSPSLNVSEFLQYSGPSGSPATTPTTSNSSSLHHFNFDFLDEPEHSMPGSATTTTLSPHGEMNGSSLEQAFGASSSEVDCSTLTSQSDLPMSSFSDGAISLAGFSFGAGATGGPALTSKPMMSTQSHNSSLDRGAIGIAHKSAQQDVLQQQSIHGRSLSLRDVAPFGNQGHNSSHSLGSISFSFANMMQSPNKTSAPMSMETALSPETEDRPSPTSSAYSSSIFDHDSPHNEKRRRLSGASKDESGNAKPRKGSASKSRSKSLVGLEAQSQASSGKCNSLSKKNRKHSMDNEHVQEAFVPSTISATSLIENMPQMGSLNVSISGDFDKTAMPPLPVSSFSAYDISAQSARLEPGTEALWDLDNGTNAYDGGQWTTSNSKASRKGGNKRPPPSASQITESGMPFPVIDTSAKHSSLFVPPDTSGLTKREARLVKNRAAAFLSRQRKREQFEELDTKCKSLCQLVWKMWQVGVASGNSATKEAHFHQLVMQDESEEVQDILETVIALEGGSIAPTEDGQLQGAIAAGIESANGKIVTQERKQGSSLSTPPRAAKAEDEKSQELSKLREELAESQAREAMLESQLKECIANSQIPARSNVDETSLHGQSESLIDGGQSQERHMQESTLDAASKTRSRSQRQTRTRSASRANGAA